MYWVGYIDKQQGDNVAAEKAMREYQRLARRMHEIDPANEGCFAEVGYAYSNLGTMFKEQGRTTEAITQFDQAHEVFASLVKTAPQDSARLLDLAQSYSWLSSSFADALRFNDAFRAREHEIAIYEPLLAREPRNAVAQERMMIARRFLAGLLLDRGELDAAALEADRAMRATEAQLRLEPDETNWQKAAVKLRLLRAEILLLQGRPQEGVAELERARPLLVNLLNRDATIWAWRVELQEALAQVESDLQRALGRRDEALRVAEASAQRLRQVMRDPRAAGQDSALVGTEHRATGQAAG